LHIGKQLIYNKARNKGKASKVKTKETDNADSNSSIGKGKTGIQILSADGPIQGRKNSKRLTLGLKMRKRARENPGSFFLLFDFRQTGFASLFR
jgi:hypothetical protein